jgi:hypothetical protein
MERDRDPVGIFVVSLLVSLLYIFGTVSKKEKDAMNLKNDSIRKENKRKEKYIQHEEYIRL